MIYLIGGPPRVGKSKLSQKLVERKNIPFCPTDAIFHMLIRTAPQLGIKDGQGYQNKAKSFYPYLKCFIHMMAYSVEDYCIEGDSFLPEQVDQLLKEEDLKEFDIRCVFLGLSKLTHQQMMDNIGQNAWLLNKSKEEQENTAKSTIERSNLLKEECHKYNLKYIDQAEDFENGQEEAYSYLLS